MSQDIVWENISREPAALSSRRTLGFIFIGIVCFFNTLPVSRRTCFLLIRAAFGRFPSGKFGQFGGLCKFPGEMERCRQLGQLDSACRRVGLH